MRRHHYHSKYNKVLNVIAIFIACLFCLFLFWNDKEKERKQQAMEQVIEQQELLDESEIANSKDEINTVELSKTDNENLILENANVQESDMPTVLKQNFNEKDFNIIFVSDLHFNDYIANKEIGITGEERAKHFLENIKKEQEKRPITALFVVGDLSADELENNTPGVQWFKDNIVDKLDIPVYCLSGNHDVKTNKKWKDIFGYEKNFVVEMGDYTFLCYDTFNDSVNKIDNTWGRSLINSNDLKNKLEQYSNKKVFVLAHFLDNTYDKESISIMSKYSNIQAVIIGHNHDDQSYKVPNANFKIYTDGNYSKDFTTPIITKWRFMRIEVTNGIMKKYLVTVENNYPNGYVAHSEIEVE